MVIKQVRPNTAGLRLKITTDGQIAGAAGDPAADVTSKPQGYQDGYNAAYKKAKTAYDTDAGTKAGTSDGCNVKPAADISKQSTDYQAAYKTAYQTNSDDYQAGNADRVANKTKSTTNTSIVGYTNGYQAGQTQYGEDKTQGTTDGQIAGAAGDPAADVTSKPQGYQDGYNAAYKKAKATYDTDAIAKAGTTGDGSTGKPAADIGKQSTDYRSSLSDGLSDNDDDYQAE